MIGAFIIGLLIGCTVGIFMISMCKATEGNDLELTKESDESEK